MAKISLIFIFLCAMGFSYALRCPICTSDPNGDCEVTKESCVECKTGGNCIQGAVKSK